MPVPQRFIDQFGSLERVPQYIRDHYEERERLEQKRQDEMREAEERKERERERIKALRRPPQNVRLVGRTVHFDPPETADQLEFAGFWVSEYRNGEWTVHGDYVLPHVRKATLFGNGPCYVETWYHQMALGEMYRSDIVKAESPETGRDAEGKTEEAPPSASRSKNPTRWQRIVSATESYSGRRTFDGRPWLLILRSHAGISDITSDERDEAHKQVAGK